MSRSHDSSALSIYRYIDRRCALLVFASLHGYGHTVLNWILLLTVAWRGRYTSVTLGDRYEINKAILHQKREKKVFQCKTKEVIREFSGLFACVVNYHQHSEQQQLFVCLLHTQNKKTKLSYLSFPPVLLSSSLLAPLTRSALFIVISYIVLLIVYYSVNRGDAYLFLLRKKQQKEQQQQKIPKQLFQLKQTKSNWNYSDNALGTVRSKLGLRDGALKSVALD